MVRRPLKDKRPFGPLVQTDNTNNKLQSDILNLDIVLDHQDTEENRFLPTELMSKAELKAQSKIREEREEGSGFIDGDVRLDAKDAMIEGNIIVKTNMRAVTEETLEVVSDIFYEEVISKEMSHLERPRAAVTSMDV